MNFDNAPSIEGTLLDTAGAVSTNSWVELDVTTAIEGDGIYSFGFSSGSSNRVTYNSKEAPENQPLLVIEP